MALVTPTGSKSTTRGGGMFGRHDRRPASGLPCLFFWVDDGYGECCGIIGTKGPAGTEGPAIAAITAVTAESIGTEGPGVTGVPAGPGVPAEPKDTVVRDFTAEPKGPGVPEESIWLYKQQL